MSQPEITFRHGLCSASIWEQDFDRDGEKLTVRTVSFQRSYLDKDGNWQTTNSLKVNDIPKAVFGAEQSVRIFDFQLLCRCRRRC